MVWFVLDHIENCFEEYWIYLSSKTVNKIKEILKKHNLKEGLWQKYVTEALEKIAKQPITEVEPIYYEIYSALLEEGFELLPVERCTSDFKVLTSEGNIINIKRFYDGTLYVEPIQKIVSSIKKIHPVDPRSFMLALKEEPPIKKRLPQHISPLEILSVAQKAIKDGIPIKVYTKEESKL